MHSVQFRSCDPADSLKLRTFAVFLFGTLEKDKSVLAEKMHDTDFEADIWGCGFELLLHPQTSKSSPRWRRNSAVTILTWLLCDSQLFSFSTFFAAQIQINTYVTFDHVMSLLDSSSPISQTLRECVLTFDQS